MIYVIIQFLILQRFLQTIIDKFLINTLNVSSKSLNLRFSVGINPAKNIFIPSLTANGIVTTP